MSPLLVVTCWLLALPAAAPSTLLNVQLDPARPTQLYRAPGGDGGPGAWIITASGPRRPSGRPTAAEDARPRPGGGPSAERAPVKQRPAAETADSGWTQHNRVEGASAGHLGAEKKPVRLPSFVVTSRPFGFQASSSSGQAQRRRPTTTRPPASGQGYSTSGQGHTTSGQGQSRPPIKSYVRPTRPRPSPAPAHHQHSGDSFVFSSNPNNRPTSASHRQPSTPSVADHGHSSSRRPSPARPAASLSQLNAGLPDTSGVPGPRPAGDDLSPTGGVSHDDPNLTPPAEVEPLAAPPSTEEATVTRKTAPDAVSNVGGKALPTFNLGCRQGRRCSFIINAPTRVPQPTFTPYNRQTVDSYLQRFQTLLAMSNARKSSADSANSSSSSADPSLASASAKVATIAAAPGPVRTATGAASATYTDSGAPAALSPGEAYREDIRRASSKESRLGAGLDRSGAALVAQRYRPGTADLYRLMRSAPATLRTVKPAETAPAGADPASQVWREPVQWSPRAHREAKHVTSGGISSGGVERVKSGSQSHGPGQRYSRYTVERVDPKTKTSYPTAWNSDSRRSSDVVPVSGTIFKAHLSSGPISFQSRAGVKQSRAESSFSRLPAAESDPRTASIITADGVRELPNVIDRADRHRAASSRHYRPAGRSVGHRRPQVARQGNHHQVVPPSRRRTAWRWAEPTLSPRKLHK